jgi:hypothetical protein
MGKEGSKVEESVVRIDFFIVKGLLRMSDMFFSVVTRWRKCGLKLDFGTLLKIN